MADRKWFKALYDFEASPDDPEQISVRAGNYLSNVVEIENGWCTCELAPPEIEKSRKGKPGIVPFSYVEAVQTSSVPEYLRVTRSTPPPPPKHHAAVPQPQKPQDTPQDEKYAKYYRMKKAGLPMGAIQNAMLRDGVDPAGLLSDETDAVSNAPLSKPAEELDKYAKMRKNGVPEGAIRNAMLRDGVNPDGEPLKGTVTRSGPSQTKPSPPSFLADIGTFNKSGLHKATTNPNSSSGKVTGSFLTELQSTGKSQLKPAPQLQVPKPPSPSTNPLMAELQTAGRARLKKVTQDVPGNQRTSPRSPANSAQPTMIEIIQQRAKERMLRAEKQAAHDVAGHQPTLKESEPSIDRFGPRIKTPGTSRVALSKDASKSTAGTVYNAHTQVEKSQPGRGNLLRVPPVPTRNAPVPPSSQTPSPRCQRNQPPTRFTAAAGNSSPQTQPPPTRFTSSTGNSSPQSQPLPPTTRFTVSAGSSSPQSQPPPPPPTRFTVSTGSSSPQSQPPPPPTRFTSSAGNSSPQSQPLPPTTRFTVSTGSSSPQSQPPPPPTRYIVPARDSSPQPQPPLPPLRNTVPVRNPPSHYETAARHTDQSQFSSQRASNTFPSPPKPLSPGVQANPYSPSGSSSRGTRKTYVPPSPKGTSRQDPYRPSEKPPPLPPRPSGARKALITKP